MKIKGKIILRKNILFTQTSSDWIFVDFVIFRYLIFFIPVLFVAIDWDRYETYAVGFVPYLLWIFDANIDRNYFSLKI